MTDLIFLLDVERNIFLSAFRKLFAFLDWVIYSLLTYLFRAVFNLANFELYGMFEAMEERVYVILGIFMLFKITISLITYLVNPDKISDKEQGASKIIMRVIVVLVMLVGLPTFFSLMNEAQNRFLPVVPRIIIGTSTTVGANDVSNVSFDMVDTMIKGFAPKKEGCDGDEIKNIDDFLDSINESCSDSKDIYKYDYLPVISTITGIIMGYVLFSLCVNVAIRAFKLIILRSIAPVPIISYIDPKSSKDGAFSSWRKLFFSTWAELFIQLGLIYFIVFAIHFMLSGDAWKGFFSGIEWSFIGVIDGILLLAFIIIGLLFFAKQAPKFVYDALGIKSTGNFMRMLGMGATAVGSIGSARAAFRARQDYDNENGGKTGLKTLRNAGASLFSGVGSAVAGGSAILSSDKPTLTTGYDAQAKNNATMLSRINAGSTLGGRLHSMGQMLIAGETVADSMSRRNKELEGASKALKDYKSTIESRFDGNEDFMLGYNGHSFNWLNFDKNFTAASNGDESAMQWLMANGFKKTVKQTVTENFDEEYRVQTGTKNIWDNDAGEYISVPTYETHTRPATREVTKDVEVVDLDKARSDYEKIHKEGYKQFENAVVTKGKDAAGNDVKDSVVYGKLVETKDALKGVVVDKYNDYGEKEEETIDLGNFEGGYSNTKASIGSVSGTQRDLVRDPNYKAAMVDASEAKKQ